MPVKTVIEAIRDGLYEEMARDPNVILLGEDVGHIGGVFLASQGLQAQFGEERVIDTPLAENAIVGVAIGAAMNGMHPVAEIQFADFIYPAFEQIVSEASKMRYRSNGDFHVPLVIRAPYGGGIHGSFYHSQSVEAFFSHVPGLKVVTPATPYDAKGMLKTAIREQDPVIFLEHKRTYRLIKGEVPDEDYTVPFGKAEIRRAGVHITLVTYGLMLHYCLEAAETLAKEGVSVEVIDLRSLNPLDKETILDSVKKTGKALVVHEDYEFGGFGGELAAMIAQEAFDHLDGPVTRLGAPFVPAMPFAKSLEDAFMLNPEKIANALRKLAAY